MTALKLQLTRTEKGRFALREDCDFLLTSATHGFSMQVKGIDISLRGFGFMSNKYLETGKNYWLEYTREGGNGKFLLELIHCESYLGIDGMFRCGAFVRDLDANLYDFCRENDLLLSNLPV